MRYDGSRVIRWGIACIGCPLLIGCGVARTPQREWYAVTRQDSIHREIRSAGDSSAGILSLREALITGSRGDTIVVSHYREPVYLPLDSIRELRRSRESYPVLWSIFGGLSGMAIGTGIDRAIDPQSDGGGIYGAIIGLLGGPVVGLAINAIISRDEVIELDEFSPPEKIEIVRDRLSGVDSSELHRTLLETRFDAPLRIDSAVAFWGTGGLGLRTIKDRAGSSFAGEWSLSVRVWEWQTTAHFIASGQQAPEEGMLSLLFGRTYAFNEVIVAALAGPGWVYGDPRSSVSEYSVAGFMGQIQVHTIPEGAVGVGLTLFGAWNPERPFLGAGAHLRFGNYWRHR